MKLILFFVFYALIVFTVNSQTNGSSAVIINDKCGTMPSLENRLQTNKEIQKLWDNNHKNKNQVRSSANYDTTGYVVIPVVFHVVHNPSTPAQNIDDTLIFSQMNVLNEDHTYTHPYTASTLAVFDSIRAITGVKFCLATVDPLGNPTNGITRTSSTTSHLLTPFNNSVKYDSTGGKSAWPRNYYLNIWVCEMAFGAVLGYAQFPWDAPATDGIVLHWNYVGEKPGASTAPNNLGRTLSHEGGHWLGMRHIWGDGACGVEDGIDDTPDSDAASAQDCMLTRNDCDDAGNLFWQGYNPVDMVQNFMDYSADACMTMFTKKQTNRMWHYIINNRDSLFFSYGCDTPSLNGYVVTKNITCSSSYDGEATAYPQVGTAPFSFLWSDALAQTTQTATALCKGTYLVRIIDANNDTIFIQSFVQTHDNLGVTHSTLDGSCDTCNEGQITVNAIGGSPVYLYSINGGPMQLSNVFDSLVPGTYLIGVLDSCGTLITDSVEIINTIGIHENLNENTFNVYPNPVSNLLKIEFSSHNELTIEELVIFDQMGRKIFQIDVSTSEKFIQIPVESLINGLYLLKIQANNEINYFYKFLKLSQ